ncbi:autophagy-related protein 27 domain-containing protein [Phanerochaete sordida]|uniref:Autophagy-related protein 27 n=1 Tax=Phanerochaete sordida TaxID=48140 RepID=A0A9P3GCT8_9APHY|nr:autophagy-related protein 27 domain-containing protein [Phanerochaete sordida]
MMLLRQRLNVPALSCALLLLAAASAAQDSFDCKVTVGESKWDLTSLAGEQSASRERDTPPTKFRDTVKFNLCENLVPEGDKDQCPADTRACLTKTNLKESESDRVTSVIPLAKSSLDDVTYKALPSPNKGLSLTFAGPAYPDPLTSEQVPQSFAIDILCDTDKGEPTFQSYDGKVLKVEWRAPAGCAFGDASPPPGDSPKTDPEPGKDQEESSSMGSGLGYFFLLLVLALVAYFGLGAYYNYSTYGASGMDLIPHRDFWREVPYMLRDVVSHLCSAVRPRSSSRGGYIAV